MNPTPTPTPMSNETMTNAPTQHLDPTAQRSQPRSCNELGLCQHRKPPCAGCTAAPLKLAPGVLQGYRPPAFGPAARHELRLLLGVSVGLVVLVMLVSGVVGYALGAAA